MVQARRAQAADGDDRVREVEEGVDHDGATLVATAETAEGVLPGMGALDVPAPAGLDRSFLALVRYPALQPTFVVQGEGPVRAVAGVQVYVIIDDSADDFASGTDMVVSKGRAVRLSPELIVEAAVRIAARADPDGLTGRSLGEELGVDRSAVWRHFADRDALMLAVGDRLLAMAVERVPDGLGPREVLEGLARSVVEVFEAHPYVGAAVACRTTCGPGEFAAMETMLGALEEIGLDEGNVARYQRMLADTVLAYAGMRAGYAALPQEVHRADGHAWAGAYATISPERYPAIATHLPHLAAQDGRAVFQTLMEAFWLAVDATVRSTSKGDAGA